MIYKIVQRRNPQKPEEAKKFYPAPVYSGEITLRSLAEEISQTCTLTQADVSAVMESLLQKLPLLLANGHSVRLGEFGIMKLSFSAKGKEKKEEVSSAEIKNTHILFLAGIELKKKLKDVSFTKQQ